MSTRATNRIWSYSEATIFLFVTIIVLYPHSALHAQQAPTIEWQRCLGGSDFEDADAETHQSFIQISDRGFIIAGQTHSNDGDVSGNHGNQDAWVVKLNPYGTLQWQKCFGGTGQDAALSIIRTFDKGYAMAGYTSSNDGDVSGNHGSSDAWIVKLDSSAKIQWQQCVGGAKADYAFSIIQTSDSGYAIAGMTFSTDEGLFNHGMIDAYIAKLSSSGNLEWQKCFGGSGNDEAKSIVQTSDGGFVFAGLTASINGDVAGYHGDSTNLSGDLWVVKLNSLGTIQWQKCLGGTSADQARTIIKTGDSGFVVTGYTSSVDGDVSGHHQGTVTSIWVVRLDTSCNIKWQKCLGGSRADYSQTIIQTSDGGYAITGSTLSNDGDVSGKHGGNSDSADVWVVKLTSSGVIEWQKCLGGLNNDYGYSIIETSDGGYAIHGMTESNDGDVSGYHGGGDMWVVKLKGAGKGVQNTGSNFSQTNFFSMYPNPSSDQIYVQLFEATSELRQIQFFDVMGIQHFPDYRLESKSGVIDVHTLSSGIYIARSTWFRNGGFVSVTVPFIVQH